MTISNKLSVVCILVRMRSVFRAFLNWASCVYAEPVKRLTYILPERNGKLFLAPIVPVTLPSRLSQLNLRFLA